MNILISGINGFIGSNVVSELKHQNTIYGLDIVTPQKDGVSKTYSWNELGQIPPVDVVIHLAGKAHDTKNQVNAQVYFDINTGLTQKIFDWFLASGASKFIFFSSVKAAADQIIGNILTEEVNPSPIGPYGESKIAAEKYLTSRIHEYTREQGFDKLNPAQTKPPVDKKAYILRPCMIHGPGNKGNLNLLYNTVKKRIPWPLGAFENKRSFASIDNVIYVINQLIEKEIPSGIYQLADDETISTNEIIRLIGAAQNKKTKIWHVPQNLISFSAKLGDLLHLPLNSERLKKLTESYCVSNQKIKKALGIEKMPVSAKEGMKKTFESFGK